MDYYHYVPIRLRIKTPFIHGKPQNATTFDRAIQGLEEITDNVQHIVHKKNAKKPFMSILFNCLNDYYANYFLAIFIRLLKSYYHSL
jgi:hypothetical protein